MISVSQADEQSTFFRYWIFTYIKKQEELEMKSYEEMTKEELLKEKEGLEAYSLLAEKRKAIETRRKMTRIFFTFILC